MANIREAARQTVLQRYALNVCLKKQAKLIEKLAREGAGPTLKGVGLQGAGNSVNSARKRRATKRSR